MEANYRETGMYTKDGESFHYVGSNLRVGTKLYCNVSRELFLSLGFYEVLKVYVTEDEYEEIPDNEWKDIDGTRYFVIYQVLPE